MRILTAIIVLALFSSCTGLTVYGVADAIKNTASKVASAIKSSASAIKNSLNNFFSRSPKSKVEQKVIVKGELYCHGKPAEGVKAVLDMTGSSNSTDGGMVIKKDGKFELNKTDKTGKELHPKLRLYHMCHRGGKDKCTLFKTELILPSEKFVKKGKNKELNHDYGKIALENSLLHTVCDK